MRVPVCSVHEPLAVKYSHNGEGRSVQTVASHSIAIKEVCITNTTRLTIDLELSMIPLLVCPVTSLCSFTLCHALSDNCVKFAIDVGIEIIILYEHIYEIYGDVRGATNSFAISAYEQGQPPHTDSVTIGISVRV